MTDRVIVIPAIKKNAVIPDQLVKRLGGITLIQRAIDTAKAVTPPCDVLVVTDSEEIGLICERSNVRYHYNAALHFTSLDIVTEMRGILGHLAEMYCYIVVYRASCPLITATDIDDAYARFCETTADAMVTVKSLPHRVWETRKDRIDTLLDSGTGQLLVESKALIFLRPTAVQAGTSARVVPYFLNDRAIEINSYQDWWICERLLARRHVVFVVAGYPAIGMGHIYRSLMVAHEIAHHKITFMCTAASELAVASIAAKDYKTVIQKHEDLSTDVLALAPDLVINDMLNTTAHYMGRLKAAGVAVANFEDEGEGAALADLVINALYEQKNSDARLLSGHHYFCLRDEFLQARRNEFHPTLQRLLITFGGTDAPDFTRQTLDTVEPLCRAEGIEIRVVTGPGYTHKEALETHLVRLGNPKVLFTSATNVMSLMMEEVDLAICSAGRTVYELAHMRVPAVVLAQNPRETQHTFARAHNGFVYLGLMEPFRKQRLYKAFSRCMHDSEARQRLFARQQRINFLHNKALVVRQILQLIKKQGE